MRTETTSQQEMRRYDLDWLRIIAITILLFYHSGMWFNEWPWLVKSNVTSVTFQYWMIWSHYFRMPLLLFISGAGTYMALSKRTPGEFRKERFKRLGIPLVFGMLVVVPPQIYYEHIKEYSGYWEFYKTVFNFVPYPKGSLSWHHLWFVLYLLIYSMLALPLLSFLKSERSEKFKTTFFNFFSTPIRLLIFPSLVILVSQITLRPYFPLETHDLINDWAYFTLYFFFFAMGIVVYSMPKLWEAIGANRKYFFVAMLFAVLPFYAFYLSKIEIITLPLSADLVTIVFDGVAILVSWFTVIAIIAYGQHYLNKPHPWLSKLSEGLYPFYILHQTVIIAVGYYVCQWDWSISAKYWSICFLTFISCVGLYLLVIRQFNMTRLLFGLKKKNDRE